MGQPKQRVQGAAWSADDGFGSFVTGSNQRVGPAMSRYASDRYRNGEPL